jgi:hypothetical protein
VSVASGLCGRCVHAREVVSGRGFGFVLCGRSREDPLYPRYPRLPVLRCPGFEPPPPSAADPQTAADRPITA